MGMVLELVESLRFLHAGHVAKSFEAEGILVIGEEVAPRLAIETLRVCAKDIRRRLGQWTVHEDRQIGNATVVEEFVKVVDDQLRASHREGGNDDSGTSLGNVTDRRGQLLLHILTRTVKAPTIRALHDEHIQIAQDIRIAEDGHIAPTNISGKSDAALLPVLVYFQQYSRRSEDMTRVSKRRSHTINYIEGAVVLNANERLHRLFGITDLI